MFNQQNRMGSVVRTPYRIWLSCRCTLWMRWTTRCFARRPGKDTDEQKITKATQAARFRAPKKGSGCRSPT